MGPRKQNRNKSRGSVVLVAIAVLIAIWGRFEKNLIGKEKGPQTAEEAVGNIRKRKFPPRRKMLPSVEELLKKGTPLQPKSRKKNAYEPEVQKTYHLNDVDYRVCARLAGRVTSIVSTLSRLDEESDKRKRAFNVFIDELWDYGLIPTKMTTLEELKGFPASAFARRMLWVIVCKKRMADNYYTAKKFIEEGQVQVGVETITNEKMFISRELESMIRWDPQSEVRKVIRQFHNTHDDYEYLTGATDPLEEKSTKRLLTVHDDFDITDPFPNTENELVADKMRQLRNPWLTRKLPLFKDIWEAADYQEAECLTVLTPKPGEVVIRMNEPYLSDHVRVFSACRNSNQKKARLGMHKSTKAGARRLKRERGRREMDKEGKPTDFA